MLQTSAFKVAQQFLGIKEVPGVANNPLIHGMLQLDNDWPQGDEIPWCSAFVNFVCHILALPRTKSLVARSWVDVGYETDIEHAQCDGDIVVLSRGASPRTQHRDAQGNWYPGHVGFYSHTEGHNVFLLGGNQGDKVSVAPYPLTRIITVRRLYD